MTDTEHGNKTPPAPVASGSGTGNRYLLFAVLAFVAMITIYLLKQNMEPPPQQSSSDATSAEPSPPSQAAIDDAVSQIEHIKGILAQDSSNFDAWTALGNLYFDINKPQEAITHYRAALAIKPETPVVMTDLATMLRSIGQPEEAVKLLQRAVVLDSTLGQAWFNLGVIYSFDLKKDRDALAAWKRFIALNPQSPHSEAVLEEIKRLEKELGS